MKIFVRFMKDEKGATVIEYGLIALFIALASIVAIKSIGNTVTNTFDDVGTNMAAR